MKAELHLEGGEAHPVRGSRITIGRGIHAEIRIADPLASREHCVVELRGEEYVLQDLDSANGTLVNGVAVQEHVLESGDRIHVGETVLLFVLDADEPAEDTATGLDISDRVATSALPSVDLRTTDVDLHALGERGLALEYLRICHEWASAWTPRSSIHEMCDHLLRDLMRSRPLARCAVVLCDATGRPIERFTRSSLPEANERILLDGADVQAVWGSRRSILRRGLRVGDRSYACAVVPLVGHERIHGVLYADDLRSERTLQDPELHALSVLGGMVGARLESCMEARRLQRERDILQNRVASELDLVGESRAMQRVMELVRKIAPAEGVVLIRGEAGTGKELVARALHLNSGRRFGPFEVVNCAAQPTKSVTSELLGYERGAFAGASMRRKGRLELADGGCVLLDEVADLGLETQGALLRVLEDRRVQRIGSLESSAIDVRVIAITRRDLMERVADRRFRQDLYELLSGTQIVLPPLREREGDVDVLTDHFVQFFSRKMARQPRGISTEARGALRKHVWPGNVRELRNMIERAVLLAGGDELNVGDFPGLIPAPSVEARVTTLEEMERDHIARVMVRVGGNKSEAARLLGVNRSTLYEKLDRYKIGS